MKAKLKAIAYESKILLVGYLSCQDVKKLDSNAWTMVLIQLRFISYSLGTLFGGVTSGLRYPSPFAGNFGETAAQSNLWAKSLEFILHRCLWCLSIHLRHLELLLLTHHLLQHLTLIHWMFLLYMICCVLWSFPFNWWIFVGDENGCLMACPISF